MKNLLRNFVSNWQKVLGAAAVVLIFLLPATRVVLGQIANLGSKNEAKNQKQVPVQQKNDSENINTNAPSSPCTVSPMGNSSGHSQRHKDRCKNTPRHK